ncbi:hypothetical protein KY284_012696 [Solanum tuberosum]|nr:hypothetical protein KY284_012696 [Solanum tuberosum]
MTSTNVCWAREPRLISLRRWVYRLALTHGIVDVTWVMNARAYCCVCALANAHRGAALVSGPWPMTSDGSAKRCIDNVWGVLFSMGLGRCCLSDVHSGLPSSLGNAHKGIAFYMGLD